MNFFFPKIYFIVSLNINNRVKTQQFFFLQNWPITWKKMIHFFGKLQLCFPNSNFVSPTPTLCLGNKVKSMGNKSEIRKQCQSLGIKGRDQRRISIILPYSNIAWQAAWFSNSTIRRDDFINLVNASQPYDYLTGMPFKSFTDTR